MGRRQSRGVALVIVLLIVAIVVLLGTEMLTRLMLNVQRAQNIKHNNQAQWYAMSAEAFARKSIQTLMQQTDNKIHLAQPWSQEFTFPLDGGGIQAQLTDMQSCFNLNALGAEVPRNEGQSTTETTPLMEAFHGMLTNLELEEPIDSFTADTVRDSLADWLDKDDRMRNFGAEDSEYGSRIVPYLTANGLMASQSELRVINGVDPIWLNQLWPLVCVLPRVTEFKVNVNTLTEQHAPFLAGLTGLTRQQAAQLIARRPVDGWDSSDDFLSESDLEQANLSNDQRAWFDVTTQYFILHTKTRYNDASFAMSSLYHVPDANNVSVIRREFGGIE